MISIIESHAKAFPNKIACIKGQEQLNYHQFFHRAKNFALYLQDKGLQNERVALQFPNSIELIIAYLGCFIANAIAVPLSLSLKQPEIDYILQRTTPKLVVSEKTFLINDQENLAPLQVSDPHQPATIFYTSGSTGKPKGVVHSLASFTAMVETMVDAVELTFEDRFLVVEPMTNASGCVHGFLAPFVCATSIILSHFNTPEFLEATIHHPTRISIMGKANQDIVNDPHLTLDHFKGIKFNLTGGDKVSEKLMRDFKKKTGVPIRMGYGMSEFLIITVNKNENEANMISIGSAALHAEIKLLDSNGKPVVQGESGEVWVHGPNCMLGYWQDEETTDKMLVNGWLRTGDLARIDQEGLYWFTGRLKHMIIRGGDNISPLEIEEVLSHHPSVNAVGVIGVSDPEEGQVPKAFVELRPGFTAKEEELLTFAKEHLEDYKVPVSIKIMSKLPRGASGKISRLHLN